MDVILDESSLLPCADWSPALRIQTLASTLKALDQLGCAHALRSLRGIADLDIGQGRGLRQWCFDRGTNREAGLLLARRLDKQPYIDGSDGLFAAAERGRAIEGRVGSAKNILGLCYAALNNSPAVALGSAILPSCTTLTIELFILDEEGEAFEETIQVCRVVSEDDVRQQSPFIAQRLENSVADGADLLLRADALFPHLRFGPRASESIAALSGREPVFHQLFRHLCALNQGAAIWQADSAYSPGDKINWSPESRLTLEGKYGEQRDFPMPTGFLPRRWSEHSKLTGGAGARLYFQPERVSGEALVLIGYFGPHLATSG